MPRREALPDDLKELCSLCRAGRLFAVQEWIAAGKRYRMLEGNFTTSPLLVSIQSGFHSLVEVLLRAGVSDEEKCDALWRAVNDRNLDLIQLLAEYGADVKAVSSEEVFWTRHPGIIRWFVDNGMDLEEDEPIAKAFRYKLRGVLGVYMGVRDQVPSARRQAAMALRHHVEEGNLKWVSLLLWADADPRLPVPPIGQEDCESENNDEDEDEYVDIDTALNQAVRYGRIEMLKKMRLDPVRDDMTALLNQYFIYPNPEIIEMLLNMGATNQPQCGESCAIEALISAFGWRLDSVGGYGSGGIEPILRSIEILAAHGVRWAPQDPYRMRCLRRSLAKAQPWDAIQHLTRVVKSGVMEPEVFTELMRTPRMKELLKQSYPGVIRLREYAGLPISTQTDRPHRRKISAS